MRILVFGLVLALAGCARRDVQPAKAASNEPLAGMATNQSPLTKYIEVSGYRLSEAGTGKLKITFTVINHSTADVGDLALKMKLTTTAAKPQDPPIAEFDATAPSLGPLESKDVSVTVPTKLRIYELPDWQFLRGEYQITSPAPE